MNSKILYALFLLFPITCQANECEDQRKVLIQDIEFNLRRISYCLSICNYDNLRILCTNDYYRGYLLGEYHAYEQMKNIIESDD